MRGFTLSYCLSYAHIPGYFTFPLQEAVELGFKRPPQIRVLLRAGSGGVQAVQRSYKGARVETGHMYFRHLADGARRFWRG
jgi:hypothetical protein